MATRTGPPSGADVFNRLRQLLHPFEDWLAASLGVNVDQRFDIVVAMVANNVRRVPGYWIQLFLATGIATLGLALNSTAVVIGGMLVSPLMGPIIELGMGFAVGSSLLVLQAALRVLLSVAAVVTTSALMTVALPFREVTPEIAARTAPTLLDLLIAIFCALAAAYATVRRTSDTAAAAAGTAIGIALVPPLCVTGFGVGTMDASISRGSGLLFIANFSAIVVFAAVVFIVLGFARVEAPIVERGFGESMRGQTTQLANRVHLVLQNVFGSRYGLAMRLLVPAVFLLVVFVPLSRALDDVTWQFRVRRAVRQAVASESPDAVQSALQVDRKAVSLRLLIVGTPEDAERLQASLTTKVAAAAGMTPSVSVIAVADAGALAAQVQAQRAALERPAPFDLSGVRQRLAEAFAREWPASAGVLRAWSLEIYGQSPPTIAVRHLGPPIGPVAADLLAQRLSSAVGSGVRVRDVAFPSDPVVSEDAAPTAWLLSLTELSDELLQTPGLFLCVSGPIEGSTRAAREARPVAEALRATAAFHQSRLVLTAARHWSYVVAAKSCEETPPSTALPAARSTAAPATH